MKFDSDFFLCKVNSANPYINKPTENNKRLSFKIPEPQKSTDGKK
jgi:hypothetical protein